MSYTIVPTQYHAMLDQVYGPAWRQINQDQAIGLANIVGGSNGEYVPTANGNVRVSELLAQNKPQAGPTSWTTVAGQQQSYNPADNSMTFGQAPDTAAMFSGLKWTPTSAIPADFDAAHNMTYDPRSIGGVNTAEFNAIRDSGQSSQLQDFYSKYVATDERDFEGNPLWWVPKANAELAAELQRSNNPQNVINKEKEYQRIASRAFSDPNTLQAISSDPWNLGFRDSVDAKFTQADVDRFTREYMTQIGAVPNSAQLIASAANSNRYIDAPKLTNQANALTQQALTQPQTSANNAFLAAIEAAGGNIPQGLLAQYAQQPQQPAQQGGLLGSAATAPTSGYNPASGKPFAENSWDGNRFVIPPVPTMPSGGGSGGPPVFGQQGSGAGAGQALQRQIAGMADMTAGGTLLATNAIAGGMPSGAPSYGMTNFSQSPESGNYGDYGKVNVQTDGDSRATAGGLLGSGLGAAMGFPGLGMLGGALGGYMDANAMNKNYQQAFGIEPISAGSAALAGATSIPFTNFSILGTSAWDQSVPFSHALAPQMTSYMDKGSLTQLGSLPSFNFVY